MQTLILTVAIFLLSIALFMGLLRAADEADLQEGVHEQMPAEEVVLQAEEAEPAEAESDGQMNAALPLRQRIVLALIEHPWLTDLLYAGLFVMLSLVPLLDLLPLRKGKGMFRNRSMILSLLYLGSGIPFLILGYTETAVVIMNALYSAALTLESVDKLRTGFSKRLLVMRILLLLLLLLNILFAAADPVVVLTLVILRAFGQIMRMAFSQIQMDVLGRIIRKTYAAEILLGLVLLMVSFSLLLTLMDQNMSEFTDALWFCFATVTTIGYGDITPTSQISRVLSVILGIYGIIVVALITSVIVNFYNEMKSEKGDNPVIRETEWKKIGEDTKTLGADEECSQ